MRPAIHVDRAVGVRAADVEDVDALQLGELDELDTVRRQELTHATRWLAPRVRLELVLAAVGVDRARPRLKRDLSDRSHWELRRHRHPGARRPSCPVSPKIARPSALRGAGPGGGPAWRPRPPAGCVRRAHRRVHPARQPARPDVAAVGCCCSWPMSDSARTGDRNNAAAPHSTRQCRIEMSLTEVRTAVAYGFEPWLDTASSVSPGRPPVDVIVTCRAFIRLLPFLASEPATVTSSPIFKRFAAPSAALQTVRRSHLGAPVGHLAGLLVLHVDVEPHVRVGPLDLGHASLQRDRLVGVELRGERMMCHEPFPPPGPDRTQSDRRGCALSYPYSNNVSWP